MSPTLLQFEEVVDPQDVFRDTPGEIHNALRKHMNFQAQRDEGETDGMVVEQTFDALDNDYDDSLSRTEFLAGALQSTSSKDSVANSFTTVDKNSDGEISHSEFITAAQGSQQMLGLSKGFRVADADRDGFLSQEEFFFISRQFYPLEWQNSEARGQGSSIHDGISYTRKISNHIKTL